MKTIILGLNTLEPDSWTRHDVEDVCAFLVSEFGQSFPDTGKIYHEQVDVEHEVTPRKEALDADVARLQSLDGVFFVLVFPAGPAAAGQIFFNVGLLVGSLIISWLLAPDKKQGPKTLPPVTGSPNNSLGNRQNIARVLGRVPYILGQVRSTPDLIMQPYVVYDAQNREVETSYLCVGAGSHSLSDIREGDTLVTEIAEMSVGVYGPGHIPTGVDGTSIRDQQIGTFIDDEIYTVRKVEAVNGQPLLPDNAFMIFGDIPFPAVNPSFSGTSGFWGKVSFTYTSPGIGNIYVGVKENTAKVRVGDTLHIFFPSDRTSSTHDGTTFGTTPAFGLETTQGWIAVQDGTGSLPDLGHDVIVTAIPNDFNITVAWAHPSATETEWAKIPTYTSGFLDPFITNGGCIISDVNTDATLSGREWIGPFFIDDELDAPNTRTVVCNFVAQNGLYADDGKTIKAFDIDVEIGVTPADALGIAAGAEVFVQSTVFGSVASRNTQATTVRISNAAVQGRYLIRARRLTRTPWKQDAPSQFKGATVSGISGGSVTIGGIGGGTMTIAALQDLIRKNGSIPSTIAKPAIAVDIYPTYPLNGPRLAYNGGGSSVTSFNNSAFLPFKGQSEDDIRWTHCYSLTTIPVLSFGDVTTIHVRTVATEGATAIKERRLNCLAYRLIQTWNGTTFGGSLVTNNNGENCLFTILKDANIGNVADSQIAFGSIASAFAAVRLEFGGATSDGIGGDEAGQFNYTFDSDNVTLEETISTICRACFCVPFRQGALISVKPDIPSLASSLVINHRNRLPGSEQRTVNFGTDEDFDSVRISYTDVDVNDPTNFAIKNYTIPPLGIGTKPKVLEVPGIRLKKHAAWHAWRAYFQILYQNMTLECSVTEEAALAISDDRLRVADGTSPATMDGEILAVSGLTLTTSQSVVTGGAPATICLQHTDGTVQLIAVASNPDSRTVVLASSPFVTLVTNPDLGVRTMYTVVLNDSNVPGIFKLAEKECTGNGVYKITCTNYSHAFYWTDGLYFWLPILIQTGLPTIRDWGPYEFSLSTIGGGGTTNDALRGTVYNGTAVGQYIQITSSNVFASPSYTKCCWTFRAAGVQGSILSSPESSDEAFRINPSNVIQGIHANTQYIAFASALDSVWEHLVLSYDALTQIMILYVNGAEVQRSISVPSRPIGNLRIFGQFASTNGFIGKADNLRYYARVLGAEEVRELYLKELIQ